MVITTIITIVSILLGLIMTLGGIAPNAANGVIKNRVDEMLNHPEKLTVRVYPDAPSFSLLATNIAYADIKAEKFTVSDFPVESLEIKANRLHLEMSGDQPRLLEPSQVMIRARVSEQGLNKFLGSDTLENLIDNLKKRQPMPVDASLKELSVDIQNDRAILSGNAETMGGFFTVPFKVSGVFRLLTDREVFIFDAQAETLNRPMSDDLVQAVVKQINPLLNLNRFSDENIQYYLREITLKDDMVDIVAEAEIKQIPKM